MKLFGCDAVLVQLFAVSHALDLDRCQQNRYANEPCNQQHFCFSLSLLPVPDSFRGDRRPVAYEMEQRSIAVQGIQSQILRPVGICTRCREMKFPALGKTLTEPL